MLFRSFKLYHDDRSTCAKEKEKAPLPTPVQLQRMTNVFSLVERFTFRPSMTESELLNPPPKFPPEIAYCAGVIMRNAYRKDDSWGGIQQCASSKLFISYL